MSKKSGEASRIVAIIQARMGSTRLPNKALLDISSKPMLWHVANRVRHARLVNEIVIATTTNPTDQAIVQFAQTHRIPVFQGSEEDVLDRFYQAACTYHAAVIVRVTSDCPLIDPRVIDGILDVYLKNNYDYVSNTLRYTYPDGLDAEVFSFAALERAWREAQLPTEREHVTPYLRTSGCFRIAGVENDVDLSHYHYRWTVDDAQDLKFVRAIYAELYQNDEEVFYMADVLKTLKQHPELARTNAGTILNEGYYRSLRSESPVPPQKRSLTQSQRMKKHAEKLIPSCSQTFSKGPTQFIQGVAPVFLQRGQGSHVWDIDGNEYIDYPMALGPIILGHNYPSVNEAVRKQMEQGITFSLPHPLEVEVAELLVDMIPCAEMVRFGKNGSDATSGAVRVARAYTGRDVIACCGYHGWQDWYIGTTTRNKGVPQAVRDLTIPFEYNKIETLERIFAEHHGQVAAVIMEPIGVVEPDPGFLEQVKEATHRHGALLISDEIVTGFRLALGGAQEYFNVIPDLACFGKAMANGWPISAVVGRREIMELFDEIFFSFTFGGEVLSLVASIATTHEMKSKNVIAHLWEQGRRLMDGYNVLAKEYGLSDNTRCIGLAPRTVITFKDQSGAESLMMKSLFQQECLKRGILFSGGQNICFSHSEGDIDHTLRVYRTVMEILADAIRKGDVAQRLEGEPVQPVFRRA
jgi:glutamate-1-semialdehyde 2,1-aminomutase/spore coat polysaccharide biosynthesis protein SpsF